MCYNIVVKILQKGETKMKVESYEEMDPELIGVGQTSLNTPSLRKEAVMKGPTRREKKKTAMAIKEKKNNSKGKTPRITPEEKSKKDIALANIRNGRKEKRAFYTDLGRSL